MNADDFLASIDSYVNDPNLPVSSADRPVRLATVDPAYSGSGPAKVTFDGEGTMGGRTYIPLVPVLPTARVAMLPVGRTYVILSALDGEAWTPALTASRNPNLIDNGAFRVNQIGATSGTSLGIDVYFLDRWKSISATNAVTWTSTPQGRVLTVPAGKVIQQTIERSRIRAGLHTLSWEGTAKGRLVNAGAALPVSAVSPITVNLDGLDNVAVYFDNGTVSRVQVERGSRATPFDELSPSDELVRCQRFLRVATANDIEVYNPYWNVALGGGQLLLINGQHPVEMRAVPTINNAGTIAAQFLQYSAGSPITRNLTVTATAKKLIGFYSSSNNGGATIPIGYSGGISTADIIARAEF